MKKSLSFILVPVLLLLLSANVQAVETLEGDAISIDAPSAILMEASSGEIIYEKDAFVHRAPASVTKLMTMLLAAEAVDNGNVKLDDQVAASAKAASMGGSQIWLEEGETMSFGEMLKCITVVSANDCCVAVAEHLAGSEEAFADKMNTRAQELGLKDTHFICCSGLSDSDEHYSCAHDLAVISRELLKHEFIKDYTTIWMDSIRGGEFGLSNTNKLIYHYEGATGLKTGFTSKAMHCLAASAQRDGVEYIAVILGAPSSSARFESAKTLLNYAFANYTLLTPSSLCVLPNIPVSLGKSDCVGLKLESEKGILAKKEESASIECELILPDSLTAPIAEGQKVGTLQLKSDGKCIDEIPILAAEAVEKMTITDLFSVMLSSLLSCP